jgi:hypothetical protein
MEKKTQIITKEQQESSSVVTTLKIKEIEKKEKMGLKLKRSEHLWYDNFKGVRRANVNFGATKEEREEYIKCSLNVFYFAEQYCKIKREDGTIGKITLRPYQKEILKLYNDNRYSILLSSRQMGKCVTFDTIINIDQDGELYKIAIGELFYREVKKLRSLTKYENIKLFLYSILKYL